MSHNVLAFGAAFVLVAAIGAAAPLGAGEFNESAARLDPTIASHRAVSLPPGFSNFVEHVFPNTDYPTALAWLPDGRMLVTSKEGRLWLFPTSRDGYGRPSVVLDLSAKLCDDTERGLVGLAVDPEFETNGYVYLYWTYDAHGVCNSERLAMAPENRVTRHRLRADGSEVVRARRVIVDHIISVRPHHIAGDLQFGLDGYLYVSVGDGVCRIPETSVCGRLDNNSQLRWLPNGKILRVTRAGLPAATNPYADAKGSRRCTRPSGVPPGKGACREIFAIGFRNPFRMARRPGTNQFYVNDVGEHLWEEIDRLRRGANYGWNVREGHCAADSTRHCGPSRFADPIHDYRHGDCRSITGGAFVPLGLWPDRFDGAYLFSDFTCDTVFRLVRTDRGTRQRTFLSGMRQPIGLRFGPSPRGRSLYYISFFRREIHRVSYSPRNIAPVAAFTARPAGLDVAFDGSRSYDPDRDGIGSWSWDFGDGVAATVRRASINHRYSRAGSYDVVLTVSDAHGATSTAFTRKVTVPEHAPTLQVRWPEPQNTYAVGQGIHLSAVASDTEDGQLAGSSIRWEFRLHHGNHFHPLDLDHGRAAHISYPPPEDLNAAGDSSLLVIVTATDSAGLTDVARHTLRPTYVALTFLTSPAGGRLRIDGDLRRTAITVHPWQGQTFRVGAPTQRINGHRYVFRAWSDGRSRTHNITTPSTAKTYTARFE